MTKLDRLKLAASIHDIAALLGFKASALAFILYKIPPDRKYTAFEIPKRSGGVRVIHSPIPQLKKLQSRLRNLLQECVNISNAERGIKKHIAHGFRPDHSIMTNAVEHRSRKYILNVDLNNFFGEINFGRVRGFFIANRNFSLRENIATILAQIACHENSLPQGSPCSPIISNLIAHPLDIQLAALAKKNKCTYTRYADDLTFSSNNQRFPEAVAKPSDLNEHKWVPGDELARIIERGGFSLNPKKTRMDYRISRQVVTGLIVSSRINTPEEKRHMLRPMVRSLIRTGSFTRKVYSAGAFIDAPGTINQLDGMLSFSHSVREFEKVRQMSVPEKKKYEIFNDSELDSFAKLYREFLLFKNFFANEKPLLVCEGKTDGIYLECAIRRLAPKYPLLAKISTAGKLEKLFKIFRPSRTSEWLLGISGGSTKLIQFLKDYRFMAKYANPVTARSPVIVMIDNDSGAKSVYGYISNALNDKTTSWKDQDFIFMGHSLYVLPTPLNAGKDTSIEDMFDSKTRATTIDGKRFNPSNTAIDSNHEYGKSVFANRVVKEKIGTIDFSGFEPIFNRILAILADHNARIAR